MSSSEKEKFPRVPVVNDALVPVAPALNVASPDSVRVVPVTNDVNVPVVEVNPFWNDTDPEVQNVVAPLNCAVELKLVAPLKLAVFDVWNRPENVASAANVAVFEKATGPANPAAPATDDVPVTVRLVTVTLPLNVGVPLLTAAAEMPPLLKT